MSFFRKPLFYYYLIFGILCWICREHIFFWDTYQLCGKQAWALYDNGLLRLILPPEIDSGHPPFFGFYHASLWKIFGPSLMVSHLAMLPFLCGIVYFFYQIGSHFLDQHKAGYLLPLLLADPVFMGQAVLASPDIVLICCMLMCLLGILRGRKTFMIIGSLGLGLISMRGMMVLGALILFSLFLQGRNRPWVQRIKQALIFSPAVIVIAAFLTFHYMQTGWFGHHAESSWADSFAYVDLMGGLRNIAVYIWRFLDFGRIFILLPFLYFSFKWLSKKKDSHETQMLWLLGLLTMLISPILILHKGLVLHRYLLPIFLVISLLFWYFLFSEESKLKKWIWVIGITGLITGNLWVYPKHISQGWDSTLGHIPYYHLRDKMINYISDHDIVVNDVGTAFPNIGPFKNYDPQQTGLGFSEYDLDKNNYIFYSSIFNDFSDQELEALSSKDWTVEKSFEFYPVNVTLYKKEK